LIVISSKKPLDTNSTALNSFEVLLFSSKYRCKFSSELVAETISKLSIKNQDINFKRSIEVISQS
jgi:hypothetical protein